MVVESREIENDLRFLLIEIKKQLDWTQDALKNPSKELISKVSQRDDHIDNFKHAIESKAYEFIHLHPETSKDSINYVKSMNSIGSSLEKIGDYCNNIASQTKYLKKPEVLNSYRIKEIFREIYKAIDRIEPGLFNRSVKHALEICKSEPKIDKIYDQDLRDVLALLRKNEGPEDHVTSLFILKYLERIGDALLNIGESIINAIVGVKLKIDHYLVLEEGLENSQMNLSDPNVEYDAILNTWSGCRIGKIQKNVEGKKIEVIFKHGNSSKILDEKESIEEWNRRFPGLAPKIIQYHKGNEESSLMMECLTGKNLKELVLDNELEALLVKATSSLIETQKMIWKETLVQESIQSKFLGQAQSRLRDVFATHEEFNSPAFKVGNQKVRSLIELLEEISEIEKEVTAPFSVRIHGDMNIDNVFYDTDADKVHFIDLHRSKQLDYVQDVSVFIVSNYRIQNVDEHTRGKLNWLALQYFESAEAFALDAGDDTFHIRLTLGLIRNFTTSTRFQLDERLAKNLYFRAIYLLEKVRDFRGKDWKKFQLPKHVFLQ